MSGPDLPIRRIDLEKELGELRSLLNEAFMTVALEFGLTPENARTNAAFQTEEDIRDSAARKGLVFFGSFAEGRMAGCYALEMKGGGLAYLERLGVRPELRHGGLGRALVADASRRAKELGASRMEIGIIEENVRLKDWYLSLGFTPTGTRTFPHLPFTVGYMALVLCAESLS